MNKKIIKWGIKDFKSIGEYTEIDLKPITLICGQNSSGKSSFINSILLMVQAVTKTPVNEEPSIPLNGPFVNLGPKMEKIIPVGTLVKGNLSMAKTGHTQIFCLIEDINEFGAFSADRFKVSLGPEVNLFDTEEHEILTNFRSFEIGSVDVLPVEDDSVLISEFQITFENHFNSLSNEQLTKSLNLSTEEREKISKSKDEIDNYILTTNYLSKEPLLNMLTKFKVSSETLDRLGKPVPEVSAKLSSAEDEIEFSQDEGDIVYDKIVKNIKSNNRYFPSDNLENHIYTPGSIFKSGIPTGFLEKQVFGDDSLLTAKQMLSELNYESIFTEIEYQLDRDIDLQQQLSDGYIYVPKSDVDAERSDSDVYQSYNSIPKQFQRSTGYSLTKLPEGLKIMFFKIQDYLEKQGYENHIDEIIQNVYRFFPKDAFVDDGNSDITHFEEVKKIVKNYFRHQGIDTEFIDSLDDSKSELSDLYDVYIDIPPKSAGRKWNENKKKELLTLYLEGSPEWQNLESHWSSELNEYGYPVSSPENFADYDLEKNIIPPFDIEALSKKFRRTALSISSVLLEFEEVKFKDLLLSLDHQNQEYPAHAIINNNIPEDLVWDPDIPRNMEDIIFSQKGVTTHIVGENFNRYNVEGPIGLGEVFWNVCRIFSFNNWDKSNEPSTVFSGLLKLIFNTINLQKLSTNPNGQRLLETLIAGYFYGSINDPNSFINETDIISEINKLDTLKITSEISEDSKALSEKGMKNILVSSEQIGKKLNNKNRSADSTYIEEIMDVLKRVKYLGPLRDASQKVRDSVIIPQIPLGRDAEYFNQYFHNWKDERINSVVPVFENEEWVIDLKNPVNDIKLSEAANKWFEYFEIAKSFHTRPSDSGESIIGEVIPVDLDIPITDEKISTKNIGVGFSQIAPIILLCLSADVDDLIILEEPESNLHPDAQRMLGEFFVAMEALGKRFIIETHSDHLINRLRLKVAEALATEDSSISSETVGIYFAEKEEGQTKYKKAKLNEDGAYDMSDYPKGFFNQATLDAIKLISLRKNK